MKLRSDSPFAKLTEEQQATLLELSRTTTAAQLLEGLRLGPEPIEASEHALRRFLARLSAERVLSEGEEMKESAASLARRDSNADFRDGALEAARQRLFTDALQTDRRDVLLDTLRALGEDKARERDLAMRERQIAVKEEHARIAWRRLDIDAALQLLPRLRLILTDATRSPEDRLADAQSCLSTLPRKLIAAPPMNATPEPSQQP